MGLTRLLVVLVIGAMTDVGVLATPAAAMRAQNATDVWDTLMNLPGGTRLRLTLLDGAEIDGRLVDARADALDIEDNQLRKGHVAPPQGGSLKDRLVLSRSNLATFEILGVPKIPRHSCDGRVLSLIVLPTPNWQEHVTGKACIRGTRIPVAVVLANLADGLSPATSSKAIRR